MEPKEAQSNFVPSNENKHIKLFLFKVEKLPPANDNKLKLLPANEKKFILKLLPANEKKFILKLHVTNSKKKTKLAWGSYRTSAAMDRILLYSEKNSNEWITVPRTARFQNKFEKPAR